MESVTRKHLDDLGRGMAYLVLATVSTLEKKDTTYYNPENLTGIVLARLKSIHFDPEEIKEWLSSDSLKKSIQSVFKDNL